MRDGSFKAMNTNTRVIAYIDGYNLYYGLKEQGWRWAYWLNLQSLVLKYIEPGQTLLETKYFTTIVAKPPDKRKRQAIFLEALQTLNSFSIYFGHFLDEQIICYGCGRQIPDHHEKMTDVNIATEMLTDFFQDKLDLALLISADSDLVPPVRAIHRLFPLKRVICLFPPRRSSKSLIKSVDGYEYIDVKKISRSLFPDIIIKKDGVVLKRPESWK